MVNNMANLQQIIDMINAGIHKFVSICINANPSYPYGDYETATLTANKVRYQVGANNKGRNASQNKFFVSKSTLIYSTVDAFVIFNGSENIPEFIIAEMPFTFYQEIKDITYYYDDTEGTIHIWTEGVLPQETRGRH